MYIPFPEDARKAYHEHVEDIFESGFWSGGKKVEAFEEGFSRFVGMPSVAFNSGGAALVALFSYANVRGGEVIVPANTFWATAKAAQMAGGKVVFADCNKDDLCLSLKSLREMVTPRTKAVCVVHIGGHIAFEIEKIAAFCDERGIALIEDCAHAHGGSYKGKSAGSWGLGGAYSFYATKTMPVGEGGMVCSSNRELMDWVGKFRNYGKEVVDGNVLYPLDDGFNYRMNEFTAALGLVQLARMPYVLQWKNDLAAKFDQIFESRVRFPEGMVSGYYKYIVFDYSLRESVGQVFARSDFGPVIQGEEYDLPNSDWVAEHHACAPIWCGWEHADKHVDELIGILL